MHRHIRSCSFVAFTVVHALDVTLARISSIQQFQWSDAKSIKWNLRAVLSTLGTQMMNSLSWKWAYFCCVEDESITHISIPSEYFVNGRYLRFEEWEPENGLFSEDSSHIRSHEWEIGDFPSKWQFPNEYDEWIIDLVASWTLPFTYKRYFCICTGANATDFVCWNVFIVCYPKTYQIVCWTNIRIEFHFWMSSSKIQHLLLSWLIRNECKFTLDRIR